MTAEKNVLTEEVAQDQFNIIIDYYNIDSGDVADNDSEKMFASIKRKLIKAIRYGHLTIEMVDEDIVVIQKRVKSGQEIKYAVLSGKHKITMEKNSNNNNYKRIYNLLSSLTNIPVNTLADFKGFDMSIIENLALLFLSV